MRNCASDGGLLPEQVWDAAPIPHLELWPGRPSGSAMPLLWSHAEFLKLLVARERGRPVELLCAVEQRYGGSAPPADSAAVWHWRNEVPIARLRHDRGLLIEDREPFTLHFGFNGWQRVQERAAEAQPFGLWAVRFSAQELSQAGQLDFTRRYPHGWENVDHSVSLGHTELTHALEPHPDAVRA
jgi:glucoamylase